MPLISIVSAISSYFINHDLGQGPVIAASIVGLVAGLFFKEPLYAVTSYSAAFMGMSSKAVIPEWYYFVLIGIIHSLVVIALLNVFVGWGGKAGTMGFIALNIGIIILYAIHPVDYYTGDPIAKIASYPIDLWITGVLVGVVGIMLTILVREKAIGGPKGNDAVVGSAIVALLGGIIAPQLAKAPFNYANATYFAAIIASGTYAGMASRKVLPKLYDYLIVGIIVGILNLLLWSIFPGFGGRLGTIGLISCAIWMALIKMRKSPATSQS
ncbi:MAG: hypothetical protein QXO34_03120 [Candidatus Bathyarchaeia archaeon]